VFVVVTLLVALGIAAAQGCQGPSRGLGGGPGEHGDGRGGTAASAWRERVGPEDRPVAKALRADRYEAVPEKERSTD